jgi:hypothetical protein
MKLRTGRDSLSVPQGLSTKKNPKIISVERTHRPGVIMTWKRRLTHPIRCAEGGVHIFGFLALSLGHQSFKTRTTSNLIRWAQVFRVRTLITSCVMSPHTTPGGGARIIHLLASGWVYTSSQRVLIQTLHYLLYQFRNELGKLNSEQRTGCMQQVRYFELVVQTQHMPQSRQLKSEFQLLQQSRKGPQHIAST